MRTEEKNGVDSIISDVKNSEIYKENANKESKLLQKLSYSLTQQEAYFCIKKAGIIKTSGKRAIVYTVLMVLAAAGFLTSYLIQRNINYLILSILCALVIAVVWIFPTLHLKKLAKINASGKVITADIYTDKIIIGGDEDKWTINLDNTNRFAQYENVLIFHTTEQGQFFIIPTRVIDEDKREQIIQAVTKGTLPYKG